MAATRRVNGRNELWAIPATGGPWRRLLAAEGELRWPVWHPDGYRIAYAARRDRNWDLYILDLRTGEERRLTTATHFDGWPAISPDGKWLAYASMPTGQDLDIFLLDLASGETRNLTSDSPFHEFEPRWKDNQHLLFVSTRNENHDIFQFNLGDETVHPLVETPDRGERHVMALSNGEMLSVVSENYQQQLSWLKPDEEGRRSAPLSLTGSVVSAAVSPDGTEIAWLERRNAGDILYRRTVDGGEIKILNGPTPRLGELAWGRPDEATLQKQLAPPVAPSPTPVPTPMTSRLARVPGLRTDVPNMNESVFNSYQRLRARVTTESGRDFLGTVSEAARPIHFYSDSSDYLSWHKAGRAVDTLFDLGWHGNFQILEIVRDDQHGQVYWRLWLRCPVQDGTCGEPLVDAPWDLSRRARVQIAPGEGGTPKSFQPGYYVDITRLMTDEGWQRIASYELPDFDWRRNMIALEYWHFQHTEGLLWYDAIREVYPGETVDKWFNWNELRDHEIPRWLLRAKGIPLPPDVRSAPAELVIP